jgi:hypothetical protein
MSTGENLNGKSEGDLLAMMGSQQITFTAFKASMLGKMAVETDDKKLTRLGQLLTAGSVGVTERRTEAPVAMGMPKTGIRERILDALMRKAKADHRHLGTPSAEAARTVKLTLQGEPFYETNTAEQGVSSLAMFMMVVGWMRHAYLGVGLASEHSLHFFLDWHAQRLVVGDPLAVVQRTLRLLIRLIDTGTRDWVGVIEQDAVLTLSMVRAAHEASSFPRTAIAPTGSQDGAEAPKAAPNPQNAPGTAANTPCKRWNTPDPHVPGASLTCLHKRPDGQCRYKHCCTKIVAGGGLCGLAHPEWQHA